MVSLDCIVFDLDGTLWNASSAVAVGWNRALATLGEARTVCQSDIEKTAGKPWEECVELTLPSLFAQEPRLTPLLESSEKEALKELGGEFYPNLFEGLRALAQRYKLFLISNCLDWYLDLFFEKSGLHDLFQESNCNGKSQLPKAEMIHKLITKHKNLRFAYVGDTAGDEQSSRRAGIPYFHVNYGFGESLSPDLRFDSFQALVDHLMHEKK